MLQSVAALQDYVGATSVSALIDQRALNSLPGLDLSLLDASERAVLALMGRGSVTPELLQVHLGWDVDRALSCLASLEIAGWVSRDASGYSANY
jgi:predicted Rossmann fold nucleotide-binding protein DprA/Smf involved in DNA uptake